METVYFNILSRLSTDLSTKNIQYRFASKKNSLAKKLIFKFVLLLSRGITVGMETVYYNVLSRLGTELFTKKIKISFC